LGLGRLNGKTALITGADSGIGKAVAIAFAREGADVLLSYLPEEEQDADDTVSWIEKAGRKAVKLPGDLREEAHCNHLVGRAIKSAIVSMTKTLSIIGMKQGIRTNAVAPGPVWTPLIPATMPEEK
jgi:NAD(P)-dependent dehydrogenase (short-subunit alcohol dehydrogenase family)